MKTVLNTSYVTKAQLKERGWTDTAIRKFTGEPDTTRRNPSYRKASSLLQYALDRIEKVEATPEFIAWKLRSQKRKESSQRGVEAKVHELLEQVKKIKVRLSKLSKKVLIKRAIQHYNDHRADTSSEWGWDYELASLSSDLFFLVRIQVNYLRHQLTKYDKELMKITGRVGKGEAYHVISKKVFTMIAETYPHLADECDRQLANRG